VNANADDLAAMSHEMRTPLNAIVGVMEFLRETVLDERQARWVEVAQNASDRLLSLINGVVDGSGHDLTATPHHVDAVGVDTVVRASVSLIEPIAIMRPVALRLVGAPRAALLVRADEGRLGQVLVNLLSNAIKFSPPAGTVTVTIREVDGRVRIEVEDEGSGIAPACADRVFVPFDRLDAAERGIAGSGLGLSISRNLVQEMAGTLEVVDGPASGATFRLELPLLSSSLRAAMVDRSSER
jgi:signal transduction histidine kinase